MSQSMRRVVMLIYDPYILPGRYRWRLRRYVKAEKRLFIEDNESTLSRLRLFAHIVDKGLNSVPWEPGRGARNAAAARDLLATIEGPKDPTARWAEAILLEYQNRAHKITGASNSDPVPVVEITPHALFRFLRERTSIRQYRRDLVSCDILQQIGIAAMEAASSCNRQTVTLFSSVIPDTAKAALKCFRGFTCFSDFVPAVIVFAVDLRSYDFPNELFVPVLDCGLATQNAVLMATSFDLSVTLLSWGNRTESDEEKLRSIFNIPDYMEIVVGAALGFPAMQTVKPCRKSKAVFLK